MRSFVSAFTVAAFASLSAGCGMLRGFVTSAMSPMVAQLADSLQRQADPDLVREGAPALILLLDGFADDTAPPATKLAAAKARIGYAAAFFGRSDADRAREIYARARDQALAILRRRRNFADAVDGPIDAFQAAVNRMGRADAPAMYAAAMAWMGWVLNSGGRMEAVAQLERPVILMRRVLEVDPGHERGGAHLFFGIHLAVQPAGAGRDLASSRRHFEQAIEAAGPGALLPRVAFAEYYARYALDRDLFERTLREIVAAEDDPPGLELMNAIARRRARALLPMAEEWF